MGVPSWYGQWVVFLFFERAIATNMLQHGTTQNKKWPSFMVYPNPQKESTISGNHAANMDGIAMK